MPKWRSQIEAWASERYCDSFAHSAIVECWDDKDYANYDSFPTAQAAIKDIQSNWVDPMNERYATANQDAPQY